LDPSDPVKTLLLFWLAQADPPEQFIEERFAAARQAEAARDYAKAAGEYRAILSKYPERIPEIYQNLGIALYLQKRYGEAIDTLQQGIRRKPAMQGAQLFLGISLLATERYKEALPPLQTAHRLGVTAETSKYLAVAQIQNGDLDGARRILLGRLQSGDEPPATLYQLGDVYLRMAQQDVRLLTADTADLRFAHVLAGRIFEMQEFHQLASRELIFAVRLDPGNASALLALARELFILGQEGPARLALERYNLLMPGAPHAGWDPAELPKAALTDVGEPVQYEKELQALPPVTDADRVAPLLDHSARAALRSMLATDPTTGQWKRVAKSLEASRWGDALPSLRLLAARSQKEWIGAYLLVRALIETDNYAGAEKEFTERLRRFQAVPTVRLLHWTIAQQQGLYYFDRLLREHPESAHAHFVKARTWRIRANRQALDEYRAAIAADPEQPEIRMALAAYLLSNSEYDEALAVCQEELRLSPYSSAAKGCIGRVHVEQRRPEEGIPLLEEALQQNPGDSELRSELARAYEMRGDTAKALDEYELSLARNPSLTRLHYVLSRLYRRVGQTDRAREHLRRFQAAEQSQGNKLRERVERFQK
jgi:tetratricopeptide (TPR) repeat protein